MTSVIPIQESLLNLRTILTTVTDVLSRSFATAVRCPNESPRTLVRQLTDMTFSSPAFGKERGTLGEVHIPATIITQLAMDIHFGSQQLIPLLHRERVAYGAWKKREREMILWLMIVLLCWPSFNLKYLEILQHWRMRCSVYRFFFGSRRKVPM